MTLSLQAKIAVLSLAATGICLYSPSAVALDFSGGTFGLTPEAGGFHLFNFENLTGSSVNDLHITLSYTDVGNTRHTLVKDFVFPDLDPGGNYTPPTITGDSNVTQGFFYPLGAMPNGDNPQYDASRTYWTKEGKKFVPGPLPILGLAAAFGFSRKLRNRIKLHKGSNAVSTSPVA